MTHGIEYILRDNLYAGVCCLPKQCWLFKKVNLLNLHKLRDAVSTFHVYRFTNFVIEKIYYPNTRLLLMELYRRDSKSIHVFYLVLLLGIIYFKNTDYVVNMKILKLLSKLKDTCIKKQPFHEIFVYFEKGKPNILRLNNHTCISIQELMIQSKSVPVNEKFKSMEKMISHVDNVEWVANTKGFQLAKSLCNFAYRYPTSNRHIQHSEVKILKSELYYPKQWLDFAYNFRQNVILNPSSRRDCFRTLKHILVHPFTTENLSFSHYVSNLLTFMLNQLTNKLISLDKPMCFCNTKCTAVEKDLETLYTNNFFIFCKTCNQPVNYQHKIYNNVSIVTDQYNSENHFACNDGCSDFDFVDLYKCSVDSKGYIKYNYNAVVKYKKERKVKFHTTMCRQSRTCFNVITIELESNAIPKYKCKSNHTSSRDTCFDVIRSVIATNDDFDKLFILNNLCVGCIVFCFDICHKKDKIRTKVRQCLAK